MSLYQVGVCAPCDTVGGTYAVGSTYQVGSGFFEGWGIKEFLVALMAFFGGILFERIF